MHDYETVECITIHWHPTLVRVVRFLRHLQRKYSTPSPGVSLGANSQLYIGSSPLFIIWLLGGGMQRALAKWQISFIHGNTHTWSRVDTQLLDMFSSTTCGVPSSVLRWPRSHGYLQMSVNACLFPNSNGWNQLGYVQQEEKEAVYVY